MSSLILDPRFGVAGHVIVPRTATPAAIVLPVGAGQAPVSHSATIAAPAATAAAAAPAKAKESKGKGEKVPAAAPAPAAAAAASASSTPAAAAEGAADGGGKKKKKAVEKYEYTNITPAGEKKDMSVEMLPAYHPTAVEAAWDAWWTACGFYKPDVAAATSAGPAGRFVMVVPPPNVTGSLHLGHALTGAIEDCMARWHRMCGRPTLWLPGTDHAGIATQAVVEKRLTKERGVTRYDLGREAFVSEVWKWKEQYGSRITQQQRHMGVSMDWSRERFTMDPMLSAAVTEAFVRLFESGLIYRDTRLVNWCCRLKTAISDIEVEYIDVEKRTRLPVPGHDAAKTYEFGVLTSFAYKVVGSAEEIVVATTRPETMLGDVAVAVHPEDARYTHLHGARLIHPFFPDRVMTVITDAELVDKDFGTGAVKITPAHDPNDYKCGKKHKLEFITVFAEDGRINDNGGPFAGMMRFDAREAVVKALNEKGLFRGKADNKMRLGVCSRSGDVVEPLIKPQWYVKCDTMGKAAADAVREGKLKLLPAGEAHETTWYHWMDNIQDWCISRQLWWGHRIPAYHVALAGKPYDPSNLRMWVVGRTEEDARAAAVAKFGVPAADITLRQDEDVLDTWFSSGLFPFATMGWPNTDGADYKAFYPNSVLETGHDILFFWVARMVMLGQQLTGSLPFHTVYLHAMVRDKYGRKMSKSLGNVVDPMEVIYGCDLETLHQKIREGNLPAKEVDKAIAGQKLDFPDGIPECGADGLRFGLLAYTVQGRDINLDISRVVAYRQFCNKLWNATRFAMTNFAAELYTPSPLLDTIDELAASPHLAPRDRWILSRLNAAITASTRAMEAFEFSNACNAAYHFWLYELCDYYLEVIKPLMRGDAAAATSAGGDVDIAGRLSRNVLRICLDYGLRLLHPMMPYVTEELWQRLPGRGHPGRADGSAAEAPSIMIAPWPTPIAGRTSPDVERSFALFQQVIRQGRSLRDDADIIPSKEVALYVVVTDAATRAALQEQHKDIMTLLRASSLKIVASPAEVEDGCSAGVVDGTVSVYLLLKGLVDPAKEIARLDKKLTKVTTELERVHKKQGMATYTEKVPKEVQEEDTRIVAELNAQISVIQGLREQYKAWMA